MGEAQLMAGPSFTDHATNTGIALPTGVANPGPEQSQALHILPSKSATLFFQNVLPASV